MKKIILATRNKNKIREIKAMLSDQNFEVLDLNSVPNAPEELNEDGDTYVHNALQKARFVNKLTGLLTIADDSGLEVSALDNAPGVFSKRFSPEQTDESNNKFLIEKLQGISDRNATYRCVIAIVDSDKEIVTEGICCGTIIDNPVDTKGFAYDPHFLIHGINRTMAQLTLKEKAEISHRGRAVTKAIDIIKNFNA